MARLEDAGLVAGQYEQKVVDGQIIKERRYALTPRGDAAIASVVNHAHRGWLTRDLALGDQLRDLAAKRGVA